MPTKKYTRYIFLPNLRRNLHLESPLPRFFLCTTFRDSAITPASPLIRNSTTLRWTLWCSHYRVAKRQQFSCPLGTAILSLKFENVVPGRWVCCFPYRGQVFFLTAPPSMSSTRTYVHFSTNIDDVTFFSITALQHYNTVFFVHISLFFESRLKPITTSVT